MAVTNDNMLDSKTLNSTGQLQLMNLLPLHKVGFKGQGIRIGVADGGFYHADSLASLPHEQWIGYADLTDCQHDFFSQEGNHGTLCLSAIMGQKSNYQGASTQAEYFLFRTEEHYTESPKEIDNWVAAIEMADSLGLHIVSTSLGYTSFDEEQFNFAYSDMDGRSSRGAQAAAIAARKGMLLVTAMGNDGARAWHYLSTPADADSILSVGAVNREGQIANFSSYGPTADGRTKPEVCAVGEGTCLINPVNDALIASNGTSFACPLIAGMAACLWSALPKASNMEIREMIIRSCDRYDQPHEQYGYGIPNAWEAYTSATTDLHSTKRPTPYTKIIHNGQLYILHKGKTYNILGVKR
jgi:subtilisin family serine protease